MLEKSEKALLQGTPSETFEVKRLVLKIAKADRTQPDVKADPCTCDPSDCCCDPCKG